jgi:uncharacterized membrane protein
MRPRGFLNQLDDQKIVTAIRDAEGKTSGEIRVFVSRKEFADPVAAAKEQFTRLGMSKTAQRNGVLIFVVPRSHTFAVIGDEAVHAQCGDAFWCELAEQMSTRFRNADFTGGIIHAIQKAGELLGKHFPRAADDINELSDTVERD